MTLIKNNIKQNLAYLLYKIPLKIT